jgi:hypothetical protein
MKIAFIERATGTNRKCSVCLQPAIRFGYTANSKGGKNKSSRTPLCLPHAVVSA